MGGVTRRSLLASLMALSLLCGGLGVASASLEVVDQSGTAGTVTIYTKDEVDNALTAKGSATDVASNTTDITNLKNAVGDAGSGLTKEVADQKAAITANTTSINTNKAAIESLRDDKLDKALANSTFATKDALNDLTNTVNDKVDESVFEAALEGKADKADTLAGYGIKDAYTKGDVDNKLNEKADAAKLADYAKSADVYTKTDADGKFATSATLDTAKTDLEGKITTAKNELDGKIAANTTKIDANKTAIDDLKTKAATTENTLTNLSGRMAAAESDIGTLKADVSTAKSDIGTLKADVSTAKSDINSLKMKDTELTGKIEAEIANRITSDTALDNKIDTEIQDRKDAIKATNDRTGGIARNLEGTQTTIEGIVKVDNQGNVKDVKDLSAETITTTGDAAIGGALGVTGATTLDGALTANGEATFKDKVSVEKDLTVNGKLNVGEIYLKNDKLESTGKKHDSATSITADGISNLAKVTEHGNTTESQFTHNEKGTFNHAKDGSTTDWKESTSNVTADGVANVAKDSKGNNNTITQTSTDTKNILTDKDGNTSTTRQDGKGIYGYAKDKDGNKSYTKQEGNRIAESVIGKDGTETKSEMTSTDITNTAKDGTITNDAKDIVNNATGDMTNTVGGNLTTTVGGNEIHDVKGTKTETVEGKVTENFKGGQETNVTGDQTTNVSGTQTTNATDINRNASSGMIDKVDNAYGTNTETKVAGKTTTEVSIKGTGETAGYIRGATESRDYLIKGTLKNSESKTAETTSTEITDGNGKISSTIQDVTQISGSVTDGTNTSVSNVKADSIDSSVTGGTSISTINQRKDSITSQVTDGTTITKTEQDTKNITNTAKDGTITNDAKDIVNNASGNMTNTVGGDLTTTVSGNELHEVTGKQTNKIDGDQENTIGGNQTTTVTGDISNKAENITNEANTKLTDKVGEHTRVLDGDGITDTVGGSTFKQRIDKIMMESKDVSIKAEETLTNEAKVITNRASEVINNEAVNINNTATGIITSKASEIKNQADKLISNKVGENTWENMENGKITTSIKDGAKQNLTQSDAAGTTQSTVDGGKSTVTIQNADGLTDAVTDGRNTSVQNQTASQIAAAVKDGAGNENASVANATTSVNTITNGTKANTVISTADGTSFINSEAAAPVTGASGAGTHLNTTIKGNTITTGKVTMDYAEVMKDLGVRGNANITGKTTTGSLEVKGESKLTGDVTMESNATVKKDLTVEGNTNLKNTKVDGTLDVTQKANFGDSVSIAKDLSVGGNATIKGDVTASSYKVGDKTYISAAGINANDQKITNVADGSISEGSKDAVNGGQLYTVKNDLEGKVNKVGANAAAMANLHPMEFDPDSKWNIAAAIGNYGSETAAALGAFYRPNDDVMVNLSTAFGTGENMVGGGVSVRLGKGGNKLSREETNALKAQVADLTARMDALLSVLNPNMSKDFPDVPENHWAYEAVSRLAGNDIVQGYPDGEFHGERTMTRYEMAEIIYNALSRGAEAEKELVEEFKPELQAMAASEKATAEKAEG